MLATFRNRLIQLGLCAAGAALLWMTIGRSGALSISDDDFARVVIAQRFAQTPTWDPSGTSWLPVPFYLDGLWLWASDGGLEAARDCAAFRGILASLCVFGAALCWGIRPAFACITAWAPYLLPTTRVLTVATVPEYLTAALSLLGLSLLTGTNVTARPNPASALPAEEKPQSAPDAPTNVLPTKAARLVGLSAFFLATLSRYEVWPVAFCLALYLGATERRPWPLLCLSGPALWLIHGALSHNNAFFFVSRVTSYKAALGGTPLSLTQTLLAYPKAVFELEPVLTSTALVAALLLPACPSTSGVWRRVASIVALSVLALMFANARDGAPTHHPERAVTLVWLTAPLLIALGIQRWPAFRKVEKVRSVALFLAAIAVGIAFVRKRPTPSYQSRDLEIAAGYRLRSLQGQPESTVVGTSDYGYFAIMAAAGRPERFVVAKDNDPRNKSLEQALGDAVRTSVRSSGARWMVIPVCLDFITDEFKKSHQVRAEPRDFLVLGPFKE